MRRIKEFLEISSYLLLIVAVAVLFLAPIGQHIWWCIEKADETGAAIALLIVGLAIFPIGWLHGVSIFLGFGGWVS